MHIKQYPVIDPIATGKNISRLRVERGMTVKQLQAFFGFEEPQAIYRWQWGKSLPSVDNLYALSILFEVSMDEIIVPRGGSIANAELQEKSCSSVFLLFPAVGCSEYGRDSVQSRSFLPRVLCAAALLLGIEYIFILV